MEIINKYENGKIYKLLHDNKVIYVGSTITKLTERLRCHKEKSKIKPDIKLYKYVSNVGWNNINIELIENCNCESKKQLETRERYFIDEMKPDLNVVKPGRTKKEWKEDNKEKMKEYHKDYNQINREKLTERKKELYHETHKEKLKEKYKCQCGSELRKSDKNRHERTEKHKKYIGNLNEL